jgi:2-polyprenyl-3-methyl-5-hydroxy-6-metoxy-1,4-benzoquinol methylase
VQKWNRKSKLFDETAHAFAESTDRSVRMGRYERGALFLREAKRRVCPGGAILDYGCGPGRIAVMLAGAGYDVTGVDPAIGMIEEARAYAQLKGEQRVRFELLSSPGVWPVRRLYDGVVCSSVVEYVPDARGFLGELCKLLRPGGILILSYANRWSLWRKYAVLRFPSAPHLALQRNIWSSMFCKKLLKEAGFDDLRGPAFFESGFDTIRVLSFLSSVGLFGTLGLISARRR